MEHVLVTGANGFIGSHLVRTLLQNKHIQLTLTDKFTSDSDFLTYCETFRNMPVLAYNLDIRNRENVFDLFKNKKIDTCIHLAGKVNVEDSIKNPILTTDTNVNGTLNILDACSFNWIRNFIFLSSASVYGNPTTLPISEDHLLRPLSPYGSSKVAAEQYVTTYRISEKIQNAISLRIFNAYSQGWRIGTDVIAKLARRVYNGLPPIIYGNGRQTRDFISVIDIVDAILLSIKAMEQSRGILLSNSSMIFNIGTGISTSINEVAEQMIRESGLELEPIHKNADNKADIKDSCADITKAKKLLQFTPKNKLKKELKNIVKNIISCTG
ncbi:MAG TPA: GDP-mannose 4,6-dehydratase [Nitrososphaeraceae archaeon]|nr:GDP-mannose 4,6-dehydratase [Nitrososphaeraceae archaeon]